MSDTLGWIKLVLFLAIAAVLAYAVYRLYKLFSDAADSIGKYGRDAADAAGRAWDSSIDAIKRGGAALGVATNPTQNTNLAYQAAGNPVMNPSMGVLRATGVADEYDSFGTAIYGLVDKFKFRTVTDPQEFQAQQRVENNFSGGNSMGTADAYTYTTPFFYGGA